MSLPFVRYSCLIIETEHAQAGEYIQTEATLEQSVQHVNTFRTITSRKIIPLAFVSLSLCIKYVPNLY